MLYAGIPSTVLLARTWSGTADGAGWAGVDATRSYRSLS
jgi:hypothetical protein